MTEKSPIVALCSCEGSMPLDVDAVKRGCGGDLRTAHHLCRSELDFFKAMLGAGGRAVTVGCTQEAPLFSEVAAESGFEGSLAFANVRETGGWAAEAKAAGPKMAAILAAAAIPVSPPSMVSMTSGGIVLIYGRDETAIEAGRRLKDILDVTVILTNPEGVQPPRLSDFPVAKGTITAARGNLGAFELTIDDFALPSPSSRTELRFGTTRRGTSRCDLILDLSGGAPLFPAPELRQGYLRADPRNPTEVERAIFDAAQLEGEFDKPRFINYTQSLCAHSRSQRTGCTRCLELCPAGAITPDGDHVAISAELCMGCGQCASVCPTGAAVYDVPPAATLLARLRAMLLAYRAAGGERPAILFHDEEHGAALIDALARFGNGLPANVLPLQVNEATSIGLDTLVSAFAYGASGLRILLRAKPKHGTESLTRNFGYAEAMLSSLGYGKGLCATIETDDPDRLGEALAGIEGGKPIARPAQFIALGSGRELLKQAVRELHAAAPTKIAEIPLPPRAPFGGLSIDVAGCTLCLACVSACPTSALSDNPERPMLKFAEDLCVQCGLCRATCPERVISLEPRMNFEAWSKPPRIIKEEEPFHCIVCGEPFGVKSTIERVSAKLQDRHWMFSGENAKRISVLKMCDDCRVSAVMAENFDPHSVLERPAPRTTEDYLREAAAARGKESPPQ